MNQPHFCFAALFNYIFIDIYKNLCYNIEWNDSIYGRMFAMKEFMEQVVRNDELKNRICSDILSGSFSHAYIIEGARGSGKHTIAKLSAAALSCENKKRPCRSPALR